MVRYDYCADATPRTSVLDTPKYLARASKYPHGGNKEQDWTGIKYDIRHVGSGLADMLLKMLSGFIVEPVIRKLPETARQALGQKSTEASLIFQCLLQCSLCEKLRLVREYEAHSNPPSSLSSPICGQRICFKYIARIIIPNTTSHTNMRITARAVPMI